jgi:hypothetical protein
MFTAAWISEISFFGCLLKHELLKYHLYGLLKYYFLGLIEDLKSPYSITPEK